MKNAIEIKNIEKKYKKGFKLEKTNIQIQSGTITGLIGENGAGKTTLLKIILGIIKQDSGEIKIFNQNLKTHENKIKEDIGVVLDNAFFPETLNSKNINNIMKDIFKNWDEKLFFGHLEKLELPKNTPIKKLSKGMRKKLEIIVALSHHPKLLILDEPTSGLDPIIRKEILNLLLKFIKDENHTILISTHITTDLEQIADKIILIDKGTKILDDEKDNIMETYKILKCDLDYFDKIDKKDIIKYRKNKYNYEILINQEKTKHKYKNCIIEKITLENLMLMLIKGEK